MHQPIKWHGGKGAFAGKLSKWIISHMPPHRNYVEPYFGGGSVLLHKDPIGINEVANDMHREMMAFWSVLSSDVLFQEFCRLCESTPFSEEVFNSSKSAPLFENRVQTAHRFFVRARMSRQGLMRDFATPVKSRLRRGMNEHVSSWLSAVDGLPDVHSRVRRVAMLCDDAENVIRKWDHEDTLFYLDPPYLLSERSSGGEYEHEMSVEDHAMLLNQLSSLSGSFILSGYDSSLYSEFAERFGWRSERLEIANNASSKKSKDRKTEVIWMNY